jgi:hypothetical protein
MNTPVLHRNQIKSKPRVVIGSRYQAPIRKEHDRDALILQHVLLHEPKTGLRYGLRNAAAAASVLLLPIILWVLGGSYGQ